MTEKKREKRRWLLPTLISVVVVSAVLIGVFIWVESTSVQWILVPSLESDHSNIAARGVITEIHWNYTSYGFGTETRRPYHVYPALVVINISQVLWTTDGVHDSLTYWKYPPYEKPPFRDICLAYDASDVPDVAVGQDVDFCGYYVQYTDSPDSFLVVISPSVNGSYLRYIRP
jgi:hypothetical protein